MSNNGTFQTDSGNGQNTASSPPLSPSTSGRTTNNATTYEEVVNLLPQIDLEGNMTSNPEQTPLSTEVDPIEELRRYVAAQIVLQRNTYFLLQQGQSLWIGFLLGLLFGPMVVFGLCCTDWKYTKAYFVGILIGNIILYGLTLLFPSWNYNAFSAVKSSISLINARLKVV